MIKFEQLVLQNYVLFDKVIFPFEKGTTFVGGANQSGKSLLFSSMLGGLYQEDKEVSFKLPTGSRFRLEFEDLHTKTEHAVEIKTNKSSKYSIFQNGEDMRPHKIVDAQNLLRQALKIPSPIFVSTTYLRANKEHPLVQNGPARRSEWLSGVLDLVTVYDDLHEQVRSKLSKLKEQEIRRSLLRDELKELVLPKMESKERYTKSLETLETIQSTLEDYNQKRIHLSNQLMMLESLPNTSPISKSVYTESKLELDTLRKRLASVVADLKIWKRIEAIQENIDAAKALKESLKHLKEKLNVKLLKTLSKREEHFSKLDDTYETQLREYVEQSELRAFLKEHKHVRIKESLEKLRKLKSSLDDDINYITQHGKQLRKLEELGSKCPTCGGKLDKHHVQIELKKLQKDYKIKTEKQSLIDLEIEILEKRNIELVEKPEKPYDPRDRKQLISDIRNLEEFLDIEVESIEEPKRSKDTLKSLHKGYLTQIDTFEEILAKYQKQSAVRSFPEDIQIIFAKGPKEVKDRIKKNRVMFANVKTKCQELTDQKERCQSIVTTYTATKSNYIRIKRRREEQEEKLNAINQELKDVEPLKALLDAFGNSGLRLQQLKESADILSRKMTEFSPLFFDGRNQYIFDMEVAQRKLNLNITRNGRLSTLSTTSGSETRFFNVLFAMSLMHLLPSRLRTDTIILDEIDSMLDKNSRERYAKDILPEVARHVDKTIVVSPLFNGELNVDADRTYRIQKSLKKGRWQSELLKL